MATEELTEDQLLQAAQDRLKKLRETLSAGSACETGLSGFANATQPSGTCKKCKGQLPEGRLFVCDACELQAADYVERQRLGRIDTNMRRSGLPVAYHSERTLAAVTGNDQAMTVARSIIAGEARGMYLWGDAGEDKTTLACATLAELIRQDRSGRYENALDIMTDIQATFTPGAVTNRQDVIAPLVQAGALLIDDFGKEKPSEFSASVIYQILDGRYQYLTVDSKRVLIIVSNHPPAAACERFGDPTMVEPIMRRISELAPFAIKMSRN